MVDTKSLHVRFAESSFRFVASITAAHALVALVERTESHERERLDQLFGVMDVPADHVRSVVDVLNEFITTSEERRLEPDGDDGRSYTRKIDDPALAGTFLTILRFWKTFHTDMSSATMLQNSLLVTMVGAFEVQVSDALRSAMTAKPEVMNAGKMEFTFDRLRVLGSFDAILSETVERTVDSLMREGRRSWSNWLRDRNVHAGSEVLRWPDLREVIERRHAIVHNSGRVTSTYISALDDEQRESLRVGEVLEVDQSYMDDAFQVLLAAGTILVCDLWKKFAEDSDAAVSHHLEFLLERMARERLWTVVAQLAEFGQRNLRSMPYEFWLYRMMVNKERGLPVSEYGGQDQEVESGPSEERTRLDNAILRGALSDAREIVRSENVLSSEEQVKLGTKVFYREALEVPNND